MSREVRTVPVDWEHPKDERGNYVPLHDGYAKDLAKFKAMCLDPDQGFEEAISYFGGGPVKEDYMPEFQAGTATHCMMYEACSEGTPISPAFATPEELAGWLAATGASAYGNMTASYEAWLRVCKGGYAPSMVISGGRLRSGVEL